MQLTKPTPVLQSYHLLGASYRAPIQPPNDPTIDMLNADNPVS